MREGSILRMENPDMAGSGVISVVGCGWLGLPLGARMIKEGWIVRGSTTRSERLAELERAGIRAHLLRLTPEPEGEAIDELFDADVLFLNIPPGRRSGDVEERHPREIRSLLPWLEAPRLRQIIFASSTSVYPAVAGVVREEDARDPATASGRAILGVERMLQDRVGEKLTIVRFAGLLGGDRNPARQLAGGTGIADGDAPVNLVGREDCVEIVRLLIGRGVRGEVLNACCDGHPTRRAFYTAEARRLGLPAPRFADTPPAGGKVVSNERLKKVLGYTFIHPDPGNILAGRVDGDEPTAV